MLVLRLRADQAPMRRSRSSKVRFRASCESILGGVWGVQQAFEDGVMPATEELFAEQYCVKSYWDKF